MFHPGVTRPGSLSAALMPAITAFSDLVAGDASLPLPRRGGDLDPQ
jgi:hypothetical protein